MEGNSHESAGTIPPSISEKRESDPDKDDNPNRGTDVLTTEDVEPATVEDTLEAGECPWCEDDFENENGARSHASQVHTHEWQTWKA